MNLKSKSMRPDGKAHINILLMLCAFLFLFINTTGQMGYFRFLAVRDNPYHMIFLFISVLANIAPPVCFMILGAALLEDREESYLHLIVTKILPLVIFILLFSFWVYYYAHQSDVAPAEWKTVLYTIYTSQVDWKYRHLYMLLAMLCVLPILRNMARSMKDMDFLWLLITFTLIQALEIVDYLLFKGELVHNSDLRFFINFVYVFYPLAGYYVENRLDEKYFNDQMMFAAIGLSWCAVMGTCALTSWRCLMTNDWSENASQSFFQNLIFIPSIGIYCLFKMLFGRLSPKGIWKRMINSFGIGALIIYLFHDPIFRAVMPGYMLMQRMIHHPFWLSAARIAMVCAVGVMLALLLRAAIEMPAKWKEKRTGKNAASLKAEKEGTLR